MNNDIKIYHHDIDGDHIVQGNCYEQVARAFCDVMNKALEIEGKYPIEYYFYK